MCHYPNKMNRQDGSSVNSFMEASYPFPKGKEEEEEEKGGCLKGQDSCMLLN